MSRLSPRNNLFLSDDQGDPCSMTALARFRYYPAMKLRLYELALVLGKVSPGSRSLDLLLSIAIFRLLMRVA